MVKTQGPEFEGFIWDSDKSDRCYSERGFDFDYAARIFEGEFIEWEDCRREYGEQRFVTVGQGRRHNSRCRLDPTRKPQTHHLGATGVEIGKGEISCRP